MLTTLLKFVLLLNLECVLSSTNVKSYGLLHFTIRARNKSYDSCSAVDPADNYTIIIDKAKRAEIFQEDVNFFTLPNVTNLTFQWSIIHKRSTQDISTPWSCLKQTSLKDLYLRFLNEFVMLGKKQNALDHIKPNAESYVLGLLQQKWINWSYFEEALTYMATSNNYTIDVYEIITPEGWSKFHNLILNQDIEKVPWFVNYIYRKNRTMSNLDQLDIISFWQIFILFIYNPKVQLLTNYDWMKTWSPKMWGFYRSQAQQYHIDQSRIIQLLNSTESYLVIDNNTKTYRSVILQVTGFDENQTYYHGFKNLSFIPQNQEDDLRSFINPKLNMILSANLVNGGDKINLTYDFKHFKCRESVKPLGVRFSLSYANQKRIIDWNDLHFLDEVTPLDECQYDSTIDEQNGVQEDVVDLNQYRNVNLLMDQVKQNKKYDILGEGPKNRTKFTIDEKKNQSVEINVYSIYEGVVLDEISYEWETQLPQSFDEGHIQGQSFLHQSFSGQVIFQTPFLKKSALLVIQTDIIYPEQYVRSCWDYVYIMGKDGQTSQTQKNCNYNSSWHEIFTCMNIISQQALSSTSSLNIECNEWSCSNHGLCIQEYPQVRCECFQNFKGRRCTLEEKIYNQNMDFISHALNKGLNLRRDDNTLLEDIALGEELLDMLYQIINLVDYQSEDTFLKIIKMLISMTHSLNTYKRIGKSLVICQQIQDYIISSQQTNQNLGQPMFKFLQTLLRILIEQIQDRQLNHIEVCNQNAILRVQKIMINTTERYFNFTTNNSLFSLGKKLNSPIVQMPIERIPDGAYYMSIMLLNAKNYGLIDDEIDSGMFDMMFYNKNGKALYPSVHVNDEVLLTIPMLNTVRSPQNVTCYHLDGQTLDSTQIDIVVYDITKQYVICKSNIIKNTVIAQRKKSQILEQSFNKSWINDLSFGSIMLISILPSILLLS